MDFQGAGSTLDYMDASINEMQELKRFHDKLARRVEAAHNAVQTVLDLAASLPHQDAEGLTLLRRIAAQSNGQLTALNSERQQLQAKIAQARILPRDLKEALMLSEGAFERLRQWELIREIPTLAMPEALQDAWHQVKTAFQQIGDRIAVLDFELIASRTRIEGPRLQDLAVQPTQLTATPSSALHI